MTGNFLLCIFCDVVLLFFVNLCVLDGDICPACMCLCVQCILSRHQRILANLGVESAIEPRPTIYPVLKLRTLLWRANEECSCQTPTEGETYRLLLGE